MKLYFAPGACSLAPHIVVREAGLSVELVQVDLKQHRLTQGGDYRRINPKGQVPALELDDGQVLTEAPAIVQFLADRRPEANLAPSWGSFERYRLLEWLNFTSSELHKRFGPLFGGDAPEAWKAALKKKIGEGFAYAAGHLASRRFLVGDSFSVADAYLYVMLRWAPAMGIALARGLDRYEREIEARPGVKAAVAEEGLQLAA